MVYVNNKKFACESCIKGHRSSSCHHTDRPLFQVKKKGRPVSQCTKCRELRQSKKMHNKCTCNEADEAARRAEPSRLLAAGSKQRRYIPIAPALPNGLQDVLRTSRIPSTLLADSRQRVDTLLNPCNCKNVWNCKCRIRDSTSSQGQRRGLDALVCAAAMQQSGASTSASAARDTPPAPTPLDGSARRKSSRRAPSRPGSPGNNAPRKRAKAAKIPMRGPDLPPILLDRASSSALPVTIPAFETMPPMSMITSLAGSGCTCGLQCACPGCVEHRGAEHASKERRDCADGCGTCVDRGMGIALPGNDKSPAPNFLDRFFACAAALPAPPPGRRLELDPVDVTVYPDVARDVGGDLGLAYGLVNLPKLECCGGRCRCVGARCGCGKTCDGCCDENEELVTPPPAAPAAKRSCCAGKA